MCSFFGHSYFDSFQLSWIFCKDDLVNNTTIKPVLLEQLTKGAMILNTTIVENAFIFQWALVGH
jgi:hypothetical protein